MTSAFNIRPENRKLTTHLPSPSSQVTPKNSLVVSQTEESTKRLRAVPKVSMLLSAMEEASRKAAGYHDGQRTSKKRTENNQDRRKHTAKMGISKGKACSYSVGMIDC